jgi:hypothetical protein
MNRDVSAGSRRLKIEAPESTKDAGSIGIAAMVYAVRQDLHYGGRMLGRKPLFTFAAILTLAIGIGANSTIFSVVNSVLLQRLPYPESNRLAVIWSAFGKEQRAPSSGPELISLRERSHLFDQFAGIWVQSAALTGQGEPEQVRLGFVTSNFLSLLSARSHAGRSFLPQEDGSDKSPVVVLSYDLWRRRYASDPRIVGQSILVSGRLCTVVGVLPAGFKLIFPEGASVPPSVGVYVPFQWDLAKQSRDQGYIRVIGRLRDGTTMRQGQAELDNIAAQLRSEFREYSEQNLGLQALSLQGDVARNARPSLLVLFAGTGLVLLIACANVAILLISRTNERRNEITLRAALGAAPARIIRQLLSESLLLSFLGGAVALALSIGILRMLWILQPAGIARTTPTGFNFTVLVFNLMVSALCGVFFGLSPALGARGVKAGVVSHLPFDDSLPNWYDYYWREGAPQQEKNTLMADDRSVLPGFFDSLGITFVAGRNFDTSDEVAKRKVVIVDDSLAKQLWPDGAAIGKELNVVNGDFSRDVAEVIGVVKHVQYHSLTNQVRPQLYLPYAMAVRANMFFTVRSEGSPQALTPSMRQEISKLDKDLPIANVRLMDDYVSDARMQSRFVAILCGSLGAIALLLSCIGIYGVTASVVTRRTKEIGIRMALGAQRRAIMMMVLRGSMPAVIFAGLVGSALSLGAKPLLSNLLFGVHSIDPAVLVSVLMFLCFVGPLASHGQRSA